MKKESHVLCKEEKALQCLAMFSIMKKKFNLQTSQKWKWYIAHKTWLWLPCVICKWRERSCKKKHTHTHKAWNDSMPCVLHKLKGNRWRERQCKKKERKQCFLPTSTTLFVMQGLGQMKGEKKWLKTTLS